MNTHDFDRESTKTLADLERQRTETNKRLLEDLNAFVKSRTVTTNVYSAYFSLNHWPDDVLFEHVPQTFGFGIEYRDDIFELRIDAPSKEDIAEIMQLECFPKEARLIEYTKSRTQLD